MEVPGTLPGEQWRRALQVEGVLVSNKGRCYRVPAKVNKLNKGKLELRTIPGGIITSNQVFVCGNTYTLMELVATAWIGPKPSLMGNLAVRFIDGNSQNRDAKNLVWALRDTFNAVPKRCFTSDGRPFKIERENVGIVR